MSSTGRSALLVPMLAAAAIVLTGCGADTTSPSGSAAMSQAEANAASDVVVSDAADMADASTTTSSGGANFSRAATPGAGGTSFSLALFAVVPWWSRVCSPAPTITTNGVTSSFVFANCAITNPGAALESIVRNGEVDVTTGSGTRTVVFKNYSRAVVRISRLTGAADTTSDTQTGTRATTDDGTTLTHKIYGLGDQATFMVTDYLHPDHATSEHQRNWTATFTADTAGSIVHDQPLPSGVWAINGTGIWTRTPAGSTTSKTWSFMTTTTNLHYNANCTQTPQFDAGTMTVVATNSQHNSSTTFTITFTGCGTYTTTITKTSTVS